MSRFAAFAMSEIEQIRIGLEKNMDQLTDLSKADLSYFIHLDELDATAGMLQEIDELIEAYNTAEA